MAKKPIGEPAVTVELPLFEALTEKSNGWEIVNAALATPLGLELVLNAAALTVTLLAKLKAPEYSVDDVVGALPSVV